MKGNLFNRQVLVTSFVDQKKKRYASERRKVVCKSGVPARIRLAE